MSLEFASRLAFILLVAIVAALALTHSLIAETMLPSLVQIAAAALMLWARFTFGRRSFHAGANPTDGGLVTTGPYAFVRHPIYSAILIFLGTSLAVHPSAQNAALVLVAAAAVGVRIVAEERLVVARYPAYSEYAARTKRLVPFLF